MIEPAERVVDKIETAKAALRIFDVKLGMCRIDVYIKTALLQQKIDPSWDPDLVLRIEKLITDNGVSFKKLKRPKRWVRHGNFVPPR